MKQTLMIGVVLAGCVWAAPASAQVTPHPDVVATVKSDLQARGVDLSGPCGGFQITKRVAWILRAEGAGTLDKPTGNACLGRAVDIIAYPDGHIFDILVDSGGANGPAWQDGGLVETSRYRPAFDPGDTPAPPVVVPPPVFIPPPVVSVPGIDFAAEFARLHAELADVRAAVDNPGWWRKALSNRYVQIVGAALVTWATVKK